MKKILFLFFVGSLSLAFAQDIDELELIDPSDFDVLLDNEKKEVKAIDISELEEIDDLESLKNDLGTTDGLILDTLREKETRKETREKETTKEGSPERVKLIEPESSDISIVPDNKLDKKIVNDPANQDLSVVIENTTTIFDVGREEKQLAELAKYVEVKIPANEWDEIAAGAKIDRYVVQSGDWLWKISKNLFGSGFYYSKIWSLNPHITNPHEIEPGMSLVFDTGDSLELPNVKVSEFGPGPSFSNSSGGIAENLLGLSQSGETVEIPWLLERQKLIDQGIYFQYASQETYEDLEEINKRSLRTDWEKYEPPIAEITIREPTEQYDESGFDKTSIISFEVKTATFLNTFVTTNIVQDLGYIEAAQNEPMLLRQHHRVYLKFDQWVKVKPGDSFSIYVAEGKVEHQTSDRKGFRYSVNAQVKTIQKINHLWEAEITDLVGLIQRKDRITVFTPKISRINQTFNSRNIEAAIIGTYKNSSDGLSFGDIVYIDRGRADGVDIGNVFEVYSFYDLGTQKRITPDPTYKTGELTIISLTDNFATAVLSQSYQPIAKGNLALSKTQEQAARASRVKQGALFSEINKVEALGLDELDVELNLDDLSKDLLMKADKIQLTDDELEELDRQEREKSIIKEHERDLRELEKLESELVDAERSLYESRVDEDKYLEQQSLEDIEKGVGKQDPNAFEGLDDIEKQVGLKFLDEDLNAKENPYGLTEFDLEEIDELLNTEL